ncbi:MAG: SMP-30/gluconolactonase/LRE family protein [Myxococcota bacterium]
MSFEVLASGYGLVEGPTEDVDGTILFSDVFGGGVYRVDPQTREVTTVVPKRRGVGGIALHADGGVVLSGRDIVHVKDGQTRTLFSIEGLPGWNDLCTDGEGRVYAGALRFPVFDRDAQPIPGECFRIEAEGKATALYGGVMHGNGIAFSPDGRSTLYHSDTRSGVVLAHDLTRGDDAIERRSFRMQGGQPDGMAVDERGRIWVASAGGGRVDRYRADGQVEWSLEVPARIVTSLCFAGEDGRDLIVTTADHTEQPELRGCVLRTRLDVPGAKLTPATI